MVSKRSASILSYFSTGGGTPLYGLYAAGQGMVFGGSRSLNRVSFSPMLAQCPGVILRQGAEIVSAKIAVCKHPVKRKTNDLSKLKYYQSDFKKTVFFRGGQSLFGSSCNVSLPFVLPLHRVSFFGFGPQIGYQFSFDSLLNQCEGLRPFAAHTYPDFMGVPPPPQAFPKVSD